MFNLRWGFGAFAVAVGWLYFAGAVTTGERDPRYMVLTYQLDRERKKRKYWTSRMEETQRIREECVRTKGPSACKEELDMHFVCKAEWDRSEKRMRDLSFEYEIREISDRAWWSPQRPVTPRDVDAYLAKKRQERTDRVNEP